MKRAGAAAPAAAAALALALLATTGGACAHRAAAPADVARRFAGAVARGDWGEAYAAMSEAYRRRVPFESFRAGLEAERAAATADGVALARAELAPAHATIDTAGGEPLALVLDASGGWRLDEAPIAPFGQQSPRAALRSLVRAIDARRYDVVLRLVPARRRAQISETALKAFWEGAGAGAQLRLLERLRSNFSAPIVQIGAEATMILGNAEEVRFVLEEGVWRIEDAG